MKHAQIFTATMLALMLTVLAVTPDASAKPKGTPGQCSMKDLNTNFGASCNDQMQDDIMKNRPYAHVLFCGGETMLCCTVDNVTNRVINCRKPAGTRIMPGVGAVGSGGVIGLQSRGIEEKDQVGDEAPVPTELTPDVVKAIRNAGAPK